MDCHYLDAGPESMSSGERGRAGGTTRTSDGTSRLLSASSAAWRNWPGQSSLTVSRKLYAERDRFGKWQHLSGRRTCWSAGGGGGGVALWGRGQGGGGRSGGGVGGGGGGGGPGGGGGGGGGLTVEKERHIGGSTAGTRAQERRSSLGSAPIRDGASLHVARRSTAERLTAGDGSCRLLGAVFGRGSGTGR